MFTVVLPVTINLLFLALVSMPYDNCCAVQFLSELSKSSSVSVST